LWLCRLIVQICSRAESRCWYITRISDSGKVAIYLFTRQSKNFTSPQTLSHVVRGPPCQVCAFRPWSLGSPSSPHPRLPATSDRTCRRLRHEARHWQMGRRESAPVCQVFFRPSRMLEEQRRWGRPHLHRDGYSRALDTAGPWSRLARHVREACLCGHRYY
jgi:hypothetical protein